MANLNKVQLIGRLGQDPEKKFTPSGKAVVNVSLATTDFFKDRNGEKQERTDWHRLILWEKLADLISEYCQKGSMIYVEGSLRNNEWQDKDNNKRSITEINVAVLQFLDSRKSGGSSTRSEGASTAKNFASSSPAPEQDDDKPDLDDEFKDDIPF